MRAISLNQRHKESVDIVKAMKTKFRRKDASEFSMQRYSHQSTSCYDAKEKIQRYQTKLAWMPAVKICQHKPNSAADASSCADLQATASQSIAEAPKTRAKEKRLQRRQTN
jgi:hypothetical protein